MKICKLVEPCIFWSLYPLWMVAIAQKYDINIAKFHASTKINRFYFIQSYVTSFNAIFYHIISVKQNRAQKQHIQPLFTKKINKYPKNKIDKK